MWNPASIRSHITMRLRLAQMYTVQEMRWHTLTLLWHSPSVSHQALVSVFLLLILQPFCNYVNDKQSVLDIKSYSVTEHFSESQFGIFFLTCVKTPLSCSPFSFLIVWSLHTPTSIFPQIWNNTFCNLISLTFYF